MSDIVSRLLDPSDGWTGDAYCVAAEVAAEGAAEIERLQALLRKIASFSRGKAGGTHAQILRLANEAERDLTKMEAGK